MLNLHYKINLPQIPNQSLLCKITLLLWPRKALNTKCSRWDFAQISTNQNIWVRFPPAPPPTTPLPLGKSTFGPCLKKILPAPMFRGTFSSNEMLKGYMDRESLGTSVVTEWQLLNNKLLLIDHPRWDAWWIERETWQKWITEMIYYIWYPLRRDFPKVSCSRSWTRATFINAVLFPNARFSVSRFCCIAEMFSSGLQGNRKLRRHHFVFTFCVPSVRFIYRQL